MSENFRPVNNTPPISFMGKIKFYGRLILDLQILTIFKDMKKHLPSFKGKVLDIGCGQSPYRFLLDKNTTEYFGIDIEQAIQFDYKNDEITPFDGKNIPFEKEHFDGLICTEVLEHVENYQYLIDEMFRVLKKDAKGVITIPWSARFHYIPYDYFRYTPSALKTMFKDFSEVEIVSRGSDISNIGNKVIVLWFRNLLPAKKWRYILAPLWVVASPILILMVIIAHISIVFKLGSNEDPLGYTILVKK
jgi:ubiquinone/menaquinone biosynthesis C-methylase UbiE